MAHGLMAATIGSTRAAMQHALVLELCDPIGRIAEIIAQHCFVVLTEGGRPHLGMTFVAGKPNGKAGDVEVAEKAIVDRAHDLALAQMRMGHRLFDREDLRERDAMLLEAAIGLLVIRQRVEPGLNQLFQLLEMGHALGVVAEAGILRQLRATHRIAEIPELILNRGHEQDRIALTVEDAQRRHREVMRSIASRLKGPAAKTRRVHGHIVVAEVAIEQRGLDELALAGAFAMEQRGSDTGERVHARSDIAEADLRQGGGAVALANHAQNARVGASDEIVTGTIRERPMLPEGRNRAHDELGIEDLDRLIAEAETTDYAGR